MNDESDKFAEFRGGKKKCDTGIWIQSVERSLRSFTTKGLSKGNL